MLVCSLMPKRDGKLFTEETIERRQIGGSIASDAEKLAKPFAQ